MRTQLLDEVTTILGYFKIVVEVKNITRFNGQSRIVIEFLDDDIEHRLSLLSDNFAIYFNKEKSGVNGIGDVPNFFVRDSKGVFLGTAYAAPDYKCPRGARTLLVLCYGLTEEQCHDLYIQRPNHDYARVATSFIEQRYP